MERVRGSNPLSSTIKAGASCTGLFRFLAYRPTFGVLRNIPRKASPRGRSSDWRDTGVSDNSNRHYNEVWSLSCLIIKGDKNIVTVTRVYIASPEGANGRNVVAYGMLNALTSKYKTMVFRPAVSNHDEFTPILLAASNAGLGVALSTGLDVHKVREDKDTARGDIVGAFNDAMDVSRADAALIVGTDKSHVNDPTSYEFDANVAADLKAGVFLAVCTIDRWPHELDETVKLSIEGMEAAGNKVLGIFVTGCEPRHAFSVKETLPSTACRSGLCRRCRSPMNPPRIWRWRPSVRTLPPMKCSPRSMWTSPRPSPRTPSSSACSARPRATRRPSCCPKARRTASSRRPTTCLSARS